MIWTLTNKVLYVRASKRKISEDEYVPAYSFIEQNGRTPFDHEIDDITYNAQQIIIDRLIGQGILTIEDTNG